MTQTALTSTATATAAPLPASSGPDEDDFPPGINPLSGLEVKDLSSLDLPPVFVSISNSPVTTRPQSGLSFSPLVFEIYIGEGVTRFLAAFYGDLPPVVGADGDPVKIGPIRSGRLPYERLRQQYKGLLVFASASDRVLGELDEYKIVFGNTEIDVNQARITVDELRAFAQQERPRLGTPRLYGLHFDAALPAGAKPAESIWVTFHPTDQVFWDYHTGVGAYVRTQDNADGKTFSRQVDKITGELLAFENVVVMFAPYHFADRTFFNIDLQYITRLPALLFRDGTVQEIFWTTGNEAYERQTGRMRPIRWVDRAGIPVALKPGKTWVEVVTQGSGTWETVASTDYIELLRGKQPGSRRWAVYFQPPVIEE